MSISLLTLVKGRRPQLRNLLRGVLQSEQLPDELVIAAMDALERNELPETLLPIRIVRVTATGSALPLAQARNAAAREATGQTLVFLDVDCIPHPKMIGVLAKAAKDTQGVVMGDVFYLPENALMQPWAAADLHQRAVHHPRRPVLQAGQLKSEDNYAMLWTLCIAMQKTIFDTIGGLDEGYTGYGAEDTDFAFQLREAKIPFTLIGAYAYHQYHPIHRPPVKLAKDLALNSQRFYEKWGQWPMEGWLQGLADMGLIDWHPQAEHVTYLRAATQTEIESSFMDDGRGF